MKMKIKKTLEKKLGIQQFDDEEIRTLRFKIVREWIKDSKLKDKIQLCLL